MEDKTKKYFLIGGAVLSIILIIGVMIITKIILKGYSWWWTGGVSIFLAIFWFIVAVIIVLNKLRTLAPPEMKQDPKEAELRAIKSIKEDENNPDNFIPKERILMMVGESGKPRTPVLWLPGTGSETQNRIDVLINLNSIKFEPYRMDNRTDDFVKQKIKTMAENPADEIEEERVIGMDKFGRPEERIISRKQSQAQVQEKKEKEELEKINKL
jgi:uncharacterized membrane protein